MMNNSNILTIMSFLSFVTDVLIDHKTPFRNVLFIVKDCLTTTGWLWVTVVSLFWGGRYLRANSDYFSSSLRRDEWEMEKNASDIYMPWQEDPPEQEPRPLQHRNHRGDEEATLIKTFAHWNIPPFWVSTSLVPWWSNLYPTQLTLHPPTLTPPFLHPPTSTPLYCPLQNLLPI